MKPNIGSRAIVIEISERSGEAVSIDEWEQFLQEKLNAFVSYALLYVLDNRRIVVLVQDKESELIARLHEELYKEKGISSAIGVGRSFRGLLEAIGASKTAIYGDCPGMNFKYCLQQEAPMVCFVY